MQVERHNAIISQLRKLVFPTIRKPFYFKRIRYEAGIISISAVLGKDGIDWGHTGGLFFPCGQDDGNLKNCSICRC